MAPAKEPRRTRPREWSPRDAEEVGKREGLGALGGRHWKVIAAYREEATRLGRPPRLRQLEALTGVGDGEMRQLFPGDAATLIARLAGMAGPEAGQIHSGDVPTED